MSFSSDIKQELNNNHSLTDKNNVECELIGYLISANTNIHKQNEIKFSTENDYNIDRFSKLLSNLNIDYDIDIVGKVFYINTKLKEIKKINHIEIKNNELYTKNIEELYQEKEGVEQKKAIIKGAFLGSGSINNPENLYHLEIVLSNEENMIFLKKIIESLNINTKELITKTRFSIYMKEAEEISNLLALIGANKAVMKFEDIRIQKEMRGKVNRIVNCETANLNKTINASIEQIGAIKKLQETGKFNKLDENLKEIAKLRLENPNISLIELGKMLKKPIGKSGVNYRLKKIMEMADEE
ncbi:MAG: DNA-binding protein WhiA [Clostridia bacterium]|nr:DNA-binding protein WhiA [Clostridium sp.]